MDQYWIWADKYGVLRMYDDFSDRDMEWDVRELAEQYPDFIYFKMLATTDI